MFDEELPLFWDERKVLLSKAVYDGKLTHEKMNHQKFQDMDRILNGEIVVVKLGSDFDILSQLCKMQSQLSPSTLEKRHNLAVLAQ